MNVKGTLEFQATQVVDYADDICLLSRNIRTIIEAYQELKQAAMEIGLKINKDKTLAMIQTRSKASKVNTDQQLHAGEHSINISLTIIMKLQKSKGD
jgi:radical SAM superfamily enzyme